MYCIYVSKGVIFRNKAFQLVPKDDITQKKGVRASFKMHNYVKNFIDIFISGWFTVCSPWIALPVIRDH